MPAPEYERLQPYQFGGALPEAPSYADAAAVILPAPLDRTTSYVPGTRNGPRELLLASAQVELWDEEIGADVHGRGIVTLPEMDLGSGTMESAIADLGRAAGRILDDKKFLITIGGEHSITSPLVAEAAKRHRGLSVLQIDAHADLRDSYQSQRHSHACAMRRTIDYAPLVQVAIRNISEEEVQALPSLKTTIFYDWNMRAVGHRVHHDRSRRPRSGYDARRRHTRARRTLVARADDAAPPHVREDERRRGRCRRAVSDSGDRFAELHRGEARVQALDVQTQAVGGAMPCRLSSRSSNE